MGELILTELVRDGWDEMMMGGVGVLKIRMGLLSVFATLIHLWVSGYYTQRIAKVLLTDFYRTVVTYNAP